MVFLATYTILHMYDVVIDEIYHFTTREKAEAWAKENGLEVVEYADSHKHVTIEPVKFKG